MADGDHRAFGPGEPIPKEHTADGRDASPPLRWDDAPRGTKSLALVCEDPDAPRGTFTHWVMWNLPAEARELGGAPPAGGAQGKNDFGKVGYGGPAPPPGKPHRYVFKLMALDRPLDLKPGAAKQDLLAAAKGHELGEARLTGKYAR